MRAIDTSVLVRLVVRDNDSQVASAMVFASKGAWVSLPVLMEAIWVLGSVYSLPAAALADAVEMLLSQTNVVIQNSDTVEGALRLFRAEPGLGFSDCLILQMARDSGHLPLGTFDRKLGQVEGAADLMRAR